MAQNKSKKMTDDREKTTGTVATKLVACVALVRVIVCIIHILHHTTP